MNYSLSNKKIKSGIFNKVVNVLHQNNLLTNLFHTTRHPEQSKESLKKIFKPHDCIPFNTGKILKQVQDDSTTYVNTLGLPSIRHLEALAEGATHVGMSNNNRCAAFTLAEVLITLGIIGIVAAMTIPTLINNYQKKQTLSKLKQTYSIISQALTMAQTEHGDTTTWKVAGITGTNTEDENFNREDVITTFAQTYFIPYIKVAKDYGYASLSSLGYDGPYAPASNRKISQVKEYLVLLSNNVLVNIGLGTHCYAYDENDNCTDIRYTHVIFWVDINGFQKPNTKGKDIFYMMFNLREKVFQMYQYTLGNTSSGYSRTYYLNACSTDDGASTCGRLIYMDGWQIKEDYPWF